MFSNTALVKHLKHQAENLISFRNLNALQKREGSPSYHVYPLDTDELSASECENLLLLSWGTILEQRQSANNMGIIRKLLSYFKCTVPLYIFLCWNLKQTSSHTYFNNLLNVLSKEILMSYPNRYSYRYEAKIKGSILPADNTFNYFSSWKKCSYLKKVGDPRDHGICALHGEQNIFCGDDGPLGHCTHSQR